MAIVDIAMALFASLVAAGIGVWILRRPTKASNPAVQNEFSAVFRGDTLQDITNALQRYILDICDERTLPSTWSELKVTFQELYPNLPHTLAELSDGQNRFTANNSLSEEYMLVTRDGDRTRVELPGASQMDKSQADAWFTEMSSQAAVSPSWVQDTHGKILWTNPAYDNLVNRIPPSNRIKAQLIFPSPKLDDGVTRRRREGIDAGKETGVLWFDVTAKRKNDQIVCHAVDIAQVVKAEIAQRNFTQTLTRTFALLPTGLAIFDRDKKLALFNPALVDLTALSPDVLSRQPDVHNFFDRLRENRHMPEPKDYAQWRDTLANLADGKNTAIYEETWSIETGQTLRVTGRPHPDKAVAFLVEDISAEITLTRHLRAEVELANAVLDRVDHAIIVFSVEGTVSFCNDAFRKLWLFDPDTSFAEVNIGDAFRAWKDQCVQDTGFESFKAQIFNANGRSDQEFCLSTKAGRTLTASTRFLGSGALLVTMTSREQAISNSDADVSEASMI